MRVTVLVAAYNAAHFLPRCLDSLLGQTYDDVEIVVIDDCSTDDTWSLLSSRFPEVKAIRLEHNMGQAVARNRGFALSTGDVVTMVDADDWLSPDALEHAVKAFESDDTIDVAVFRLYKVFAGDDVLYADSQTLTKDVSRLTEYTCDGHGPFTGHEAFRLSLDWRLHGLYVARRSLYERFPYDTTTRLYSDDNTTRLHYLFARKVVFCDGAYYYCIHSQSCTNGITFSRFNMLAALRSLRRILMSLDVTHEDIAIFEGYRWRMFVDAEYILNKYKVYFTRDERRRAARMIAAAFKTFSGKDIPWASQSHLGYLYMPCMQLMRIQMHIYFILQHYRKKYFS